MNFIETLFGISPDGGSGTYELLVFLIPVAFLVAIRAWRMRRSPGASLPEMRRGRA